jgi:hypothetical protein
MLDAGGGEYAADLADQRALYPEAAGLVGEVAHSRAHLAEAVRWDV